MALPTDWTRAVDAAVDAEASALADLSLRIHGNPELRFQEEKASAWIAEYLETRGFRVERPMASLPTALRAEAGKGPRALAILGEYDALPEIGHACGHNLIAVGAVAAFLAAARTVPEGEGRVLFLGTPAEEGGGGKIRMIEAGLFDGLDGALMFHPFDRDVLAHPTLASLWLSFEFRGEPSHAAIAPHQGHSALTACLDTFRLIDGQRVHFRDGVRVHGYVTNGGQAVNIIPERASCEFSVRAGDAKELQRVRGIVERCARAAAMASDVTLSARVREGYREMKTNVAMARIFGHHLEALGRHPVETDPSAGAGSTDMGDVSQRVPAIHPWVGIVAKGSTTCHEPPFAEAAASSSAHQVAMVAAKAMARTTVQLLTDPAALEAVRREWASKSSAESVQSS